MLQHLQPKDDRTKEEIEKGEQGWEIKMLSDKTDKYRVR